MITAQPPRVLVADAEPYICRVFQARLEKNRQFQVVTASQADLALEAALASDFDVLLWDMRLSDTDRVLPRLRALCPHAVLLLMTTDDRPGQNIAIARLGIAEVLVKPFGLDHLVERLTLALNRTAGTAAALVELVDVGQEVTVTSAAGACATRVLGSYYDTFSIVAAPRVQTPSDWQPDVLVEVMVQGEDALYRFPSHLQALHSDPIPCWELEMPATIFRDQRRVHVRNRVRLPIVLHVNEEFPTLQALTENLSLVGCAVVSPQPLPIGELLSWELQTGGEAGIIHGEADVLRCSPMSVGSQAVAFQCALRFQSPAASEEEMQTLVALVESIPGIPGGFLPRNSVS